MGLRKGRLGRGLGEGVSVSDRDQASISGLFNPPIGPAGQAAPAGAGWPLPGQVPIGHGLDGPSPEPSPLPILHPEDGAFFAPGEGPGHLVRQVRQNQGCAVATGNEKRGDGGGNAELLRPDVGDGTPTIGRRRQEDQKSAMGRKLGYKGYLRPSAG